MSLKIILDIKSNQVRLRLGMMLSTVFFVTPQQLNNVKNKKKAGHTSASLINSTHERTMPV